MMALRERVIRFIGRRWLEEEQHEAAVLASVRAQTMRCCEKVAVPAAMHGQRVLYGFMADTWDKTAEVLAGTDIPVQLVFPARTLWSEVNEGDVVALQARLDDEVVLRLRLLDVVAAAYPAVKAGQEWLSRWMREKRWVCPQQLERWGSSKLAVAHGTVEHEFACIAVRYPDRRAHFYAWLIHFLVASAQSGKFEPLLVRSVQPAGKELVEWLLAFHDRRWSCEEREALAQLATAWTLNVQSVADLRSLLPPTSCPTFADFVACCDSIGTAAGSTQRLLSGALLHAPAESLGGTRV